MPVWLLGLLKYVPFIGKFIDKFFSDSSRAAEIRAQVELEEARAFGRGRISPRYWRQYLVVAVFFLVVVLIITAAIFPEAVRFSDSIVSSIVKAGKELSGMGF